jgi:hypothetical protein
VLDSRKAASLRRDAEWPANSIKGSIFRVDKRHFPKVDESKIGTLIHEAEPKVSSTRSRENLPISEKQAGARRPRSPPVRWSRPEIRATIAILIATLDIVCVRPRDRDASSQVRKANKFAKITAAITDSQSDAPRDARIETL